MEVRFSKEVLRKLILAWDPDFTKQTTSEATHLKDAIHEMEQGDYYTLADVEALG